MDGRCPDSDVLTQGLPATLGPLYGPKRIAAASRSFNASGLLRGVTGCCYTQRQGQSAHLKFISL